MVFQMSPKYSFFKSPVKLKSFKRDLAPVGFYFDIFATEIFKIPVMPVPMRIDKLTNGNLTLFIFPDIGNLNKLLKKLGLTLNFKKFFLLGISNFINFAKGKYKEIIHRNLKHEMIIKWFENSRLINIEIPSLTEAYTYLLLEFLNTFSNIEEKRLGPSLEGCTTELLRYCDKIISYTREKIENNLILIKEEGSTKEVQLYFEKKEKYYPQIIAIKIDKKTKMNFIPYLIYDDILDIFSYNEKILLESKQVPVDMTIWKSEGIINKRSNLKYSNGFVRDVDMENIDIEKVL
ncbi:hypothetical protein LCGC14_0680490 [marine sediment metagenome]|uniref:Uncharacterized protein n=1 Tax=marine sediment metagenome TaxID=412755 RepID=A0A0F9T9N9_9ZZZZ|nr:MAG: hypothetical protein Lokiarch_07510 [Candidatus Lokiarchaeum sp. GC14_75]